MPTPPPRKRPVVDPAKLIAMLADHEGRLARLEGLERARHSASPLDRFPLARLVRDRLLEQVGGAGSDAADAPPPIPSADGPAEAP